LGAIALLCAINEIRWQVNWNIARIRQPRLFKDNIVADDESAELVAVVADEIMAYLKKNESAGDTASGVHQWWLQGVGAGVDVGTVELALQRLAARGAIGARVLASGEVFYFGRGPQRGERA
jgi:hypothetical protein